MRAVQLREKDLSAAELLPLAGELRSLTREFGARLLINDRVDVALATGADGVHLGGHSLPAADARRLLGPDKLIGVSTHRIEEIRTAEESGADFVTFGPVWFTPSKAPFGEPVGLAQLREACAATALPVFALGGVPAGAGTTGPRGRRRRRRPHLRHPRRLRSRRCSARFHHAYAIAFPPFPSPPLPPP